MRRFLPAPIGIAWWGIGLCLSAAVPATAQDTAPQGMNMNMTMPSGWQFMNDGVLLAEFNHQGGARGGNEFVAPNWWMGMATRDTSRGRFTFTGMFSVDAATVGKNGYRELFQSGEALQGQPLIDRQHPHDLFMQMAGVWRIPIASGTGFTIAGGPAGEAALGPVAFMHRASAIDNPTAPLGHHIFDSTHIAFGVVTAAVDRGPLVVEVSAFNGREPDDNRWDFDFGRLDSVSGRVWFRPTPEWEFQASTGHLKDPEELEPGAIERSTASVSWTRQKDTDISSVTMAYGRNDTEHGTRHAVLIEAARHAGLNSLYSRFEVLQVETALLQSGRVAEGPAAGITDTLSAFTFGGARDLFRRSGFEGGVGADLTLYAVPGSLQAAYGRHPVSLHLFFRLRPPAGSMGRMWNMRMSQPMLGRSMPMNHQMP